MSSEKYFIIEGRGVRIHLFADTDLDDVIITRQDLKLFERVGFKVKESPAAPPYESYVETQGKKRVRIECDDPNCIVCQEGGVVEVDEHQPWTAWTCSHCSVTVIEQETSDERKNIE